MEDYFRNLQHLFKIKSDLDNGTYKRMTNKERVENFNNVLNKFKLMNKFPYIVNKTCTTDCKVGNTNKSFNNDMKPITIKDMVMGNIYKNRYIKFEIVTELVMMTSIMFLGKDDNEDLVLIAINNFENYYGTKDYKKLNYIFQKGKYILVLEPFYKMFGSGEDGIRIEDPNEIIIFDDKEWLKRFIEMENKNDSFNLLQDDSDKNYDILYKEANKSLSIENYTTALAHFIKLKSIKPEEIIFDLKIAECYFGIPYYTKVIEKCDEILSNNSNKININDNEDSHYMNALLLKAKSLIKLKKINKAKNILDENKEIIEKNKNEFKDIEEDIKNRILNIKGQFDFGEIYLKSKESSNLNIGEYINNKLEIKFSSDKGIYIITKEKLHRSELLIVSKALVLSSHDKNENKKSQYIKYDNPEKDEFEKTKALLVYREKEDLEELLSYKISNYPEDLSELFYLYDGKNKNLNLKERYNNKTIDLRKIQRIIDFNAKTLDFKDEPISEGLWYYPSLFNHSCIPNCFYFGFGDVLIIIALNDIEPNSELFINYFHDDMVYDTRQKFTKKFYDFKCHCELCKYEKNKFKSNNEKVIGSAKSPKPMEQIERSKIELDIYWSDVGTLSKPKLTAIEQFQERNL